MSAAVRNALTASGSCSPFPISVIYLNIGNHLLKTFPLSKTISAFGSQRQVNLKSLRPACPIQAPGQPRIHMREAVSKNQINK